jgi:DNA recombination protein RmuC
MLTIIISLTACLIVAIAAFIAVRRAASGGSALSETEVRLNSRLDDVLKTAAGSGSEARNAIHEKITELYDKIEERNRSARSEMQTTLDQFRGTLDVYRESLNKSLETTTASLTARFEKLQESNEQKLTEIRGEVEKKLEQTQQSMTQTFGSMFEHLSKLQETNQNIMQFSQEMHELQGILKAPRLRGELGEVEMERMLRDCLSPDQFAIQYEIDRNNRVDAVIFNPEGKLPIDSKFPLEAWRRMHILDAADADRQMARREFIKAVKGHIETIAQKYIRPPLTLDFAVMYVPAEGVYYDLMEMPELAEFARLRRVFPASPVTFWALLQVTVIGFRGLRITENARHIAQLLNALKGDLSKFREAFRVASKQIGNAKDNMDDAGEHLERFSVKLEGLDTKSLDNGTPPALEPPPADTP